MVRRVSLYPPYIIFTALFLDVATGYNCSATCACTREKDGRISAHALNFLSCTDADITVLNVSDVDVFIYRGKKLFDTSVLTSLPNLKALRVFGHMPSLSSLPPMKGLMELMVENSKLSYLSSTILRDSTDRLVNLSLSSNSIEFIGETSLLMLKQVKYLDLSNNNLKSLAYTLFKEMHQLRSLNLSHNQLSILHSKVFADLRSLETLNLENNVIYQLELMSFAKPIDLLLCHNPMQSIAWAPTNDHTALRRLSICNTEITQLSAYAFSNLTILESLELSANLKLEVINSDSFYNDSIKTLLIQGNPKLSYIDAKAFSSLTEIETLILDSNPISLLAKNWSDINGLKTISAKNVTFQCDCNSNWILERGEIDVPNVIWDDSSQCQGSDSVNFKASSCEPTLAYNSKQKLNVEEGSGFRLLCKVAGYPEPHITWTYRDQPISSHTNVEFSQSELTISTARSTNAGVYRCTASNSEGTYIRLYNVTVLRDNSKIIVLKSGVDFIDFSWRLEKPSRHYKAIIIDVRHNNYTTMEIPGLLLSRHSQSLTANDLDSDTTYRICIAFQEQEMAESDRCETITTMSAEQLSGRGITDYSLFGVIIAAVVTFIFIAIVGCVCVASRSYASRAKKAAMTGMVSESSYGLMTTSFSQRSALSTMFDNPANSETTPTNSLNVSHSFHGRGIKRTASDPTMSISATAHTLLAIDDDPF